MIRPYRASDNSVPESSPLWMLTVSVYPLDRRSDGGRGEGVTISRQRRRCRGMTTVIRDWRARASCRSRLCRWSPRIGRVITATTTTTWGCSSNAAAVTILPTTSAIRRSVDGEINAGNNRATGPRRKLSLPSRDPPFREIDRRSAEFYRFAIRVMRAVSCELKSCADQKIYLIFYTEIKRLLMRLNMFHWQCFVNYLCF